LIERPNRNSSVNNANLAVAPFLSKSKKLPNVCCCGCTEDHPLSLFCSLVVYPVAHVTRESSPVASRLRDRHCAFFCGTDAARPHVSAAPPEFSAVATLVGNNASSGTLRRVSEDYVMPSVRIRRKSVIRDLIDALPGFVQCVTSLTRWRGSAVLPARSECLP
jgi:hypothetical protein